MNRLLSFALPPLPLLSQSGLQLRPAFDKKSTGFLFGHESVLPYAGGSGK